MAGKADKTEDCRICGLKGEDRPKEINYLYTYRDKGQNIIWYVLCKSCDSKGLRLPDIDTNFFDK